MGQNDGRTPSQDAGPLSNVPPGHPCRTPTRTTPVQFVNVICDAGKRDAVKVARPVWRGQLEKGQRWHLASCLPYIYTMERDDDVLEYYNQGKRCCNF